MAEVAGKELVFRVNPLTEQVVLAAAMQAEPGSQRRKDLLRHPPDAFLVDEHRAAWAALREADRRGLGCDPATLSKLAGGAATVEFLAELTRHHQAAPDDATLTFHVEALLWDRQRHVALTGPIAGLLEAIQKHESPDRVRALAKSVAGSFEGWSDRQYLLDGAEVVRQQMDDIRRRAEGKATYPTGIDGFDFFEDRKRRIVPGFAPGMITVVTGVPGIGKSTVTARMVLGQLRLGRRVLYGAWEMTGGITLELLACMSLAEKDTKEGLGDWSRVKLKTPADYPGWLTEERMAVLKRRMQELVERGLRFMANPFRRGAGGRPSNERNLDLIAGYIADVAPDVFVADLWKRCLVKAAPEDEEEALYRQQAMAEELGVHCVLLQQQRSKDIELRPDKRPTREGIKGSGAWTEVPDNIFGVHRQANWKPVPDDTIELDVLKQRYGRWPLAVECDWNPDRAIISGGRSVDYDQPTARGSETSNKMDRFLSTPTKREKK